MASLISLGLKGKNGKYTNITINISDDTNEYGNNVSAWIEQTEEERKNKSPRNYIGNGKVYWHNGTILKAGESQESEELAEADGLDF